MAGHPRRDRPESGVRLGKSHELEIAEGLQIRVLDLEAYIALKEQLGGEKDRAVLPTLRRTLEERNRARQR